MLTITEAAQQFLNHGEQNQVLSPIDYDGAEHLLFDIVDFSDQKVKFLIDDKYVIVYVVRDTGPGNWEDVKQNYTDKCLGTSALYPEEIRKKLIKKYGKQPIYKHLGTGEIVTSFDWDTHKDEFDKSQFEVKPNATSDYACASKEARDMLWSSLTDEEIAKIHSRVVDRISDSLNELMQIETCVERPYSVHVFNETSDSFTRVFETYEQCLELIEDIHTNKLTVLLNSMVIA